MVDEDKEWELTIPNRELKAVYPREILRIMHDPFSEKLCKMVRKAIRSGDPEKLEYALTKLLEQTVSFYDLLSESECQAWLLGLFSLVMSGYRVISNQEAGEGRYDICLRPRTARDPGVLIELKHEKSKKASLDKMKKLATEAVRQIHKNDYAAELRRRCRHYSRVRDSLSRQEGSCGYGRYGA